MRVDIKSEDKWGSTTFQTADVTATGRLVLHVLNDFIRSRGPFEQLASHAVDSFLTRAQVFALLEQVPGLVAFIEKHRSAGFSGTAKYDGRGQPDDNGSLHLTLSEHEFEELDKVLPAEVPSGQRHASPVQLGDGRALVHFSSSSHGRYFSMINGPHEVMRQLAYETSARWD